MITRFRVQNYKALRDVTLDLTPMHLLIGPNDSGKTSILEALAALCRSVDNELKQSFLGSWSDDQLVWSGATSPIVVFEADGDQERGRANYSIAVRFNKGRQVLLVDEHVRVSWRDQIIDVDNWPSGYSKVCQLARENFRSGESEAFGELAEAVHRMLSGVQFYRWVPRHLALPTAPDSLRRFQMDPSGFGLALCLDDILGYDRDRFIALENRFKSIFPQVESIKLIPGPAYKAPVDNQKQVLKLQESDGKGIYFQFTGGSKPVSASQVSDGVLLVLAYLAILYLPEPPRVLLVEEPENGIHPARLQEVLTILRDLVSEQSHTQVILTSHSPYVVSLFEPEEVTLCHKDADGAVTVRRLSESETVQSQIDFFTLGEIWTGEGDEALMEPVKTVDQPS
ncbi:MAG: AAA family ATPase [Planctomycetaceae bacterium]